MKTIRFLTISMLAIAVFAVSAQAQRRSTRRSSAKPAATATTAAASSEIREGKMKVALQLNNVADFNYKLGGIATGLEDMDKLARQKPLSQGASSKHNANKQAVVQLIHNLQVGMAALEVEFRTKPGLKKFQFNVGGISALVGQSEDQAAGGQFVQSGRTLLQVIQKLSDTLVAMP